MAERPTRAVRGFVFDMDGTLAVGPPGWRLGHDRRRDEKVHRPQLVGKSPAIAAAVVVSRLGCAIEDVAIGGDDPALRDGDGESEPRR